MKDENNIDILLATYNGESYIREQIESLMAQTTEIPYRVLIGDDGSSDRTLEILASLADKYSNLVILEKDGLNIGPAKRFDAICRASTAKYVMFCDQDDIWSPQKIAITLERFRKIEILCVTDTPILVHTDLEVVSDDGSLIHSSFILSKKINPRPKLCNLLIENAYTGCTIAVNRSLIEIAMPIPESVIMHDWWLGLVAQVFGCTHFINIPLIKYRQHNHNVMGFKRKLYMKQIIKKMSETIISEDVKTRLEATSYQAQSLLKRIEEKDKKVAYEDYLLVKNYSRLEDYSYFTKRWIIIKNQVRPASFGRCISLYARMWHK